ncbi:PoNe immunity protein domain-containing protein [Pseudoduganella plicata]|nr:PoNe immunity protein domain-containing protein [Pseudoduganella plicata]
MSPEEFKAHRRQKFLSYEMYCATKRNQHELIATSRRNLSRCQLGTEDHTGELRMIFAEKLWLWLLEYTAGAPIEEISRAFVDVVADFVNWNESFQAFAISLSAEFPEDGPYEYAAAPDFENLADYQATLQLLSIAILLRDRMSVNCIISILRSHVGTDALFDELIEICGTRDSTVNECILGEPYDTLVSALWQEDDIHIAKYVSSYLTAWYPAMSAHPRWYNGHLRLSDNGYAPYYGYWAFEAAAVMFLLDVDDDGIDNIVYPDDLVSYAKISRIREREIGGKQSREVNRVLAGDMCPREGFWETPAKVGSRKQFKFGEIMPAYGGDYGVVIWQWSLSQDDITEIP